MNQFKVGHLTVTIRQDTDAEAPFSHGVTIRDYFAAAALQGFMAAHTSGGCLVDDLYAKYAYDLADAMLKAREVKP